ncbi:MAG: hypothetical protein K2H01_09850 [Ruminococcus sp.]|nr:hypothetical protein [Ruminococcus sp.]
MKGYIISAFGAAIFMMQILSLPVSALEETVSPVDGIIFNDTSGKIYIHMQNDGVLCAVIEKTEPEGVFLYYNAIAEKADNVYAMPLSCCEYLVESGEYASYYTVDIFSPLDKESGYQQNIIIKDPGFEEVTGSEYHFYITMKAAEKGSYNIRSSNESVKADGTFVCKQYIELAYSNAGDVDGNGKIDIADATAVLTIYAKQAAGISVDEFTKSQKNAADINKDDKVDIADATEILSIYSKNAAGLS